MFLRFLGRGFGLILLAVVGVAAYGFVSGDIVKWQPVVANYVSEAGAKIDAMRKPKPPAPVAEAKPPAITVIPAKAQEVVETVVVTGTLVAEEEVVISVDIDGQKIVELNADQGDTVKQGQVLARLNRDSLEVQLAESDAALAKSDVAIQQAETQVTQAELAQTDAQTTLDRTTPLQAKGYATTSQLDSQTIALRTAKSRLENAKAGLDFAKADRKSIEASRQDTVLKLSKTELKAPTDGLVLVRNGKLGQLASGAGDPLFRIARDGKIELDAEVTESLLHQLAVGQKVAVRPAGFTTPVEGVVRLVTPQVDQTTRLGHVRVSLPADAGLRVGSFARGEVVTARHTGVALPITAIQVDTHETTAQVVKDGRIDTRKLVTGIRGNGLIEIMSGIAAGESVVLKAGTFVRDGDQVTPIDASVDAAAAATGAKEIRS
jgi:RND family efflux transporter MFP subunit